MQYPLKFAPVFKDYLWGGQNLKLLGKQFPGEKAAESWEISAHKDGMSIAANGPLAGKTLAELVSELQEAFVGTLSFSQYQDRFPLLLKLIDAQDSLSVQVHPNDAYARTYENDLGKTEMWLILEAAPDAAIIYGFKQKMTREAFAQAIEAGKIGDCLSSLKVKKGDVIYIPAGTVHAIGKGIMIAEIQQSSNATYRLYDFDRKNPDGTTRPLHIQKALDTINFDDLTRKGIYKGLSIKTEDGLVIKPIIADPHFCTELLEIDGKASLHADGRSFQTLMITEGSGELVFGKESLPLTRGESVLIPANTGQYTIKGCLTALRSYVGDVQKDIIQPLLDAGWSREEIDAEVAGLDQF
jgi:mannose-6-phosphate isomerase